VLVVLLAILTERLTKLVLEERAVIVLRLDWLPLVAAGVVWQELCQYKME